MNQLNTSTKKITEQEKTQIIEETQKASQRIARLRESDAQERRLKMYFFKFELILWLLTAMHSLWRRMFN